MIILQEIQYQSRVSSFLSDFFILSLSPLIFLENSSICCASDSEIEKVKHSAVEHMNEDHEDAMITICEGIHKFKPKSIKITDLDSGGIMMASEDPKKSVYTSFNKRIKADDLRIEIVNLVKEARSKL